MTETKTQIRPGTVAFMGEKGGAPGRSFKQFIDMVYADETLSPKVRELIFIGIQTAMDIEGSLRSHIPRATKAGATKQEIAAAMMIAVANGGVQGALRGLTLLEEI
jgi:alkylhydroperoxidase/carboxymuconolactone decarboxylase family protein YurZ